MTFTLQGTADALEHDLRAHRPALDWAIDWVDELVFPAYGGLSLRNVPHSIAAVLGLPLAGSAPLDARIWGGTDPTGQVDRVVVFLMDGLGYWHLRHACAEDADLRATVGDLTAGRGALPLTSVMPSTTAVALTTLWTGATPGMTGLVGTLMYLREFSLIGDMLKFTPATGQHEADAFVRWGLRAEEFVPVPGLAEHLLAHGVATHLVLHRPLAGTGLSRILHRGTQHQHVHLGYSDMLLRVADTLRQTRGTRSYVSIYHPGLDTLAHAYGAHNRYTHAEIRALLGGLRDLLADPTVQDGRTLFLLLADHGHYDAPHTLDFATEPRLAALTALTAQAMSGDQRLTYLHLRQGTLAAAQAHIAQEHGDWLACIPRAAALAAGLYGTGDLHPALATRLGDLILVPRLGYRLTDPAVIRHTLVSVHAGLSPWEMLIPLLWKVL